MKHEPVPTVPTSALRENFRGQPFFNPTLIRSHELGTAMHRMDLNECPFSPSPKVLAAIAEAMPELNRYPDGTCPRLTQVLAERAGVSPNAICWGAGSTQLLTAIAQIAVDSQEQIVVPDIVWRRFAGVFQIVAAQTCAVATAPNGAIDVPALIDRIGNQTRLVVVLSPNNPTGLMLSEADYQALADRVPDNVLLFLDEAYHEFALHAGGVDPLPIMKARKGPWVITRTFSKAYALAGLRLGYALCSSEEIANALRLATSTFNLASIAEPAALAALDDPAYTRMILDQTKLERDRIIAGLRAMGLDPLPSITNFVSADIGRPAQPVVEALREHRVRIATWGYGPDHPFIRVSTGLAEDTDAFLEALRTVLSVPHPTER